MKAETVHFMDYTNFFLKHNYYCTLKLLYLVLHECCKAVLLTGDSLRSHNGQPFTTIDNDNDILETDNCAEKYKGGWWYRSCLNSNLNGLYLNGDHTGSQRGQGMVWKHWFEDTPTGLHYSFLSSVMKIRPDAF